MKRIVQLRDTQSGRIGRALECSGLDGVDGRTVYDWRNDAMLAFELGLSHPAELRAMARGARPVRTPRTTPAVGRGDLETQLHALSLQIRGLQLEQAEVKQLFEEDRNGTAARKLLDHFAELAQLRDPSLSKVAALELAIRESPQLYDEYRRKVTATVAGGPVREPSTGASARVVALAEAEQAKDGSLSLAAAMQRVFAADPALYEAYTAESAVKV